MFIMCMYFLMCIYCLVSSVKLLVNQARTTWYSGCIFSISSLGKQQEKEYQALTHIKDFRKILHQEVGLEGVTKILITNSLCWE